MVGQHRPQDKTFCPHVDVLAGRFSILKVTAAASWICVWPFGWTDANARTFGDFESVVAVDLSALSDIYVRIQALESTGPRDRG